MARETPSTNRRSRWMDVLKPQPTLQLGIRARAHPANQHDALMSPNRTVPEMLLPLDVALLTSPQLRSVILLLLNYLPCRGANRRGPRLPRSPSSHRGETWRQLVQRVTPLRFTQVGLPQTVAQCPGNRDSHCVPDLNVPITIRESTHVQR